ncbi:MAG TPA: hypothetical protein VM597_22380 [Gemmataceae bacterium]|nr:hypothetical protein [Gemmataceae bacterium]
MTPTPDADLDRPGCDAGRAALQRLLDGEPAWDAPEAEAHRLTCADCREELGLARGFVRLPAPVVPAGLADRVLDTAVGDRRRRRRLRFAGAGMTLAASVLVGAFAVQSRVRTQAVSEGSHALARPKAEPARPLGDAVAEARDALVALSRRTATETRDRSALLIPPTKLPDMPEPDERLEPLADARSGATRSMEPFAESARRAVNFFLKAADPPARPKAN